MSDREQRQRERAYRIWEDEGRIDGRHLDHWQLAEDQHEATEQVADDVEDVLHKLPGQKTKDGAK